MTTYRTGTHHGVTINRESDGHQCEHPDHDCARGHLVAVVVNDDWALAERICTLLNMQQDREDRWTAMEEARDAPPGPLSAPESAQNGPAVPAPTLHRPERRGSDSEGYGQCTGCGDLWPCAGYRGETTRNVECKLVRPAGPGPTEPCACRAWQPCALGTVI